MRRHLHRAYLRARQRQVLRILEDLERSQWLSPDEIEALQRNRLRALLQHAAANVPFYRKAFHEAGIDPRAIEGPEVLASLPVVTKEMIRGGEDLFVSQDAAVRGTVLNQTGGSTGKPLQLHQDRDYRLHRQAVMYRGFRWCGWRIGGPLAYVWGSDIDATAHRGLGAIRDALFGVTWIDAFTLEQGALDAVLARIGRADPEILIGYTSTLRLLARKALGRGGGPRVRSVETSAELLTAEARQEIETAFSTRVLDRYGCREAGVIAHECGARQGWHINAETVLLEIEADGGLLVTTLMNRAMPLIRYRNEDLADLSGERCPCGRGLPLMSRVVGRRSDLILSPSGRAVHGEFFTHLFYGVPGVAEFQVVQETASDLVIRIVAEPAFSETHRRRIEAAIREHADPGFRVRWESVVRIPREASGKFRFTISMIDPHESRGGRAAPGP